MNRKKYSVVGLGGTFDHFHLGHQAFINFASRLGDQLIIGITADHLTSQKFFASSIEPLKVRVGSVKHFCHHQQIKAEIEIIHDVYGSTLSEQSPIQALVVTAETLSGAEKINQARQQLHLPTFPIISCALVKDDAGKDLHSERIRGGEVSRDGQSYLQIFQQPIVLTDQQKGRLRQPQGQIVDRLTGKLIDRNSLASNRQLGLHNDRPLTILVGDSTIEKFLDNNWQFDIGIFDKYIQRQPATGITQSLVSNVTVANPAGTIQPELAQAISVAIQPPRHTELVSASSNHTSPPLLENQPYYIYVDGEEDLAAIPTVLLAPLNSLVYYGQPNEGLVEITINEQTKQSISKIIVSHL